MLDSSALQTLNELAIDDDSLTDRLIELRDNSQVIYCEAAKNERRQHAKGEPVTIWAASGWRGIKATATVEFASIGSVLQRFGADPTQQPIMDLDNDEVDQQQALVTVSLAHQLGSIHDVFVVSDEEFTLENRCTVIEACTHLGISHCTVKEFLEDVGTVALTTTP